MSTMSRSKECIFAVCDDKFAKEFQQENYFGRKIHRKTILRANDENLGGFNGVVRARHPSKS